MLDTRIGIFAKNKSVKVHISDMETLEKNENLPPGFNPKIPTVTVQHTPSVPTHQLPPSIMPPGSALQGPPHGTQGHNFFAPPGTGFYGGHSGGPMPHMRGTQFHGNAQSMYQQQINEPQQKSEEPDASELAMLGIDPSDFAEFGE